MKTADQTSLRPGLTLVEVLVAMVIVFVLLAVLLPNGDPDYRNVSRRSMASANARAIAQVYLAYADGGSLPRTISTPTMATSSATNGVAANIEDVAFILSKFQQLNDASVWYIRTDENLTGQMIPRSVILGDPNQATTVSNDFQKVSPKAWAFVTGLPMNAPASTTPLLWTYGLQHDGTWVKNSPWQGRGGHVAFLDGHVDWVEKLSNDPGGENFAIYPTNPNGGKATLDYNEAINSHDPHPAIVVNAMGR